MKSKDDKNEDGSDQEREYLYYLSIALIATNQLNTTFLHSI